MLNTQAADRRGVSVEVLAREALERAVDYDDWFLREVDTGLSQIDAGQTLPHDAVGARLGRRWPITARIADAASVDGSGGE